MMAHNSETVCKPIMLINRPRAAAVSARGERKILPKSEQKKVSHL